MLAQTRQEYALDTWTQELSKVEIASDFSRAILTVPLMHIGANKKNLFWSKEMLEKLAPMFRGVAFRYDLDGQEGSSHTTNKLSSPHFDVGWTYKDNNGAWFDEDTLWIRGEVTHPQVIQKLARKTSDGQREINYASMGVLVESAACSICGAEFGSCDHERGQSYNMETAYKVPTDVSKALHAALTNDPADGEAEIIDCIFQEMGGNNMFMKKKEDGQDNKVNNNDKENNTDNMSPNENKLNPNQKMNTEGFDQGKASTDHSQMPGGMAPSSHLSEQPGASPSPQDILKDLAERVKTIEQTVATQESPELINASPQDQFTQDNMGNTTQFEAQKQKQQEDNMVDVKDGQTSNTKTPINPEAETQDENMGYSMEQVMGMLQQILQAVGGNAEMQDMGKEAQDATKGLISHDETKPTEHTGPGDMVSDNTAESNKKNKQHMNEPGKVATADDKDAEAEDAETADEKDELAKLKIEMADQAETLKALRKNMELQDNNVPEFGGQSANTGKELEVADMTAAQRTEAFGEYGAFDAIFKGKESAQRFKRQ